MKFPLECQIKNNKYLEWYVALIEKARSRILPDGLYKEKHHAIPKCIGGKNDSIVLLTAREHFIAHHFLVRFVKNISYKQKLLYALWGMCNQKSPYQKRIMVSSRTYEQVKQRFSKSISGDNHWMKDPERRRKMSELHKGVPCPEAVKRKLSLCFKGRECKWKDKIGLANRGKKRTTQMNFAQGQRLKEAYANGTAINPTKGKTRNKFQCPYCHQMVDIANMKRWHNKDSKCMERLIAKKNKPGKRGKNKKPYPLKQRTCEHCGAIVSTQGYNRWHGNNCRAKGVLLS